MEQLNDTMTYYETLKKVVDYLNDTNGQVSDLTDSLTYLQDEGLDLSVLDNFNTKLNDGTIGNLINNTLLNSKVNQSDIGNLANLTTSNKTNLVNAINSNVSLLAESTQLKGTTQSIIFNTDGTVQKVQHKDPSNNILREDVFTYAPNLITEVRTLSVGGTLTFKYHLDTLETEVI
jgi:hypothetical protein